MYNKTVKEARRDSRLKRISHDDIIIYKSIIHVLHKLNKKIRVIYYKTPRHPRERS